MSVIAWDGKFVAADKQASRNNVIRVCTKIIRYKDKILGGVGTDETSKIMIDWYIEGADPRKWPKCQENEDLWSNLFVFDKDGCRFTSMFPRFVESEDNFFAWGSGEELAIGAMAAGANAIEAVEIACKFSDSCGLGIDAYELDTMNKIKWVFE